jgi:hypothetical protein
LQSGDGRFRGGLHAIQIRGVVRAHARGAGECIIARLFGRGLRGLRATQDLNRAAPIVVRGSGLLGLPLLRKYLPLSPTWAAHIYTYIHMHVNTRVNIFVYIRITEGLGVPA